MAPFGMGPGMGGGAMGMMGGPMPMPMGMMQGDMGGMDDHGYGLGGHMQMREDGMRGGDRGGLHGQERYRQEEYEYDRNNEDEFGPNRRERRQDLAMTDRSGAGLSLGLPMHEEERRGPQIVERDYSRKDAMDNSERGYDRKRSRSREREHPHRVGRDADSGKDKGERDRPRDQKESASDYRRKQGNEVKGRVRDDDRGEGDSRRLREDDLDRRERNQRGGTDSSSNVKSGKDRGRDRDNPERRRR